MKSALKIVILIIVLFAASPAAADWLTLPGQGLVQVAPITADAAVSGVAVSGQSAFHGIVVKTDGVNNVTLNVYDNTAAAGTTLIPVNTVILGSDRTWAFSWSPAVKCSTGIYVSIAVAGGGTATYKVQYDK